MKSENRFFQTANAVFFWLWLLSIFFSVWIALGFVAWFLPFNTVWISVIRNYSWLYLGIGCLIHIVTIVSHQQILFVQDFPSQLPTNLTFSLFYRRTLWLFLWNGPCYALTAIMVAHRLSILSLLQKGVTLSIPLYFLLILWVVLCTVLFLTVHWVGITLIYRYQGKTTHFFLMNVWIRSLQAILSHLPVWYITYSLITGILISMGVLLWSYWSLGKFLYTQSFWHSIYPEGWLLSFTLTCIGLESLFLPLFSLASSETNRTMQTPQIMAVVSASPANPAEMISQRDDTHHIEKDGQPASESTELPGQEK